MLTWTTGTFELEPPDEKPVLEEIQESTEGLLMEGMRQLDEFRNLQKQLPPLGSPLAVPTPLAGKLRELSPEELDTSSWCSTTGSSRRCSTASRAATSRPRRTSSA